MNVRSNFPDTYEVHGLFSDSLNDNIFYTIEYAVVSIYNN